MSAFKKPPPKDHAQRIEALEAQVESMWRMVQRMQKANEAQVKINDKSADIWKQLISMGRLSSLCAVLASFVVIFHLFFFH